MKHLYLKYSRPLIHWDEIIHKPGVQTAVYLTVLPSMEKKGPSRWYSSFNRVTWALSPDTLRRYLTRSWLGAAFRVWGHQKLIVGISIIHFDLSNVYTWKITSSFGSFWCNLKPNWRSTNTICASKHEFRKRAKNYVLQSAMIGLISSNLQSVDFSKTINVSF